MDTHRVPAPTLAAVRLARAQRDLMLRRVRIAGLVSVGLVLIIASSKHPGPGLHGESLGVLLSMAGVAVGGVAALSIGREAGLLLVLPFLALLAGAVGLAWLEPNGGAGSLSFFIAVAAALRLMPSVRRRIPVAAALALVGVVLVLTEDALHARGQQAGWHIADALIAVLPGVVIVGAVLARRLDRDSYQIERLLIELEKAQDAEVRAAALAERQRLAREMHDVLAHSLSGLALQLEGARLLAVDDAASPRLTETIERAHHLARSGLQEARRAIGMLRDEEELPGPERLAALAAEFEAGSGVACSFAVTGEPHQLGSEARLALYRVAQEALTNIRKHAQPERAEVRLAYEPDGTRLTVGDVGRDLEPVPALAGGGSAVSGSGYGLTGMRERAELLGGRLTAGPTSTGFQVELWVPA
ncbi:MAG TPA: histidine kinase [Streptosporangiaceae bacterium]|nr:histidine kinase [Streptosporangiaceae bacterium]